MRPLPTQSENLDPAPARKPGETAPGMLELGQPSSSNQRRNTCPIQRTYPWLLVFSTLLAGTFCYLYLTKPVIPNPALPPVAGAPAADPADPAAETLPDDADNRPAAIAPGSLADSAADPFEQTNLRIQHILAASGPGDENLGRITLDVPVLYRSGAVRWSTGDVAKARSLLTRIQDHRERSRELRDEAVGLITEWDELVIRSIPAASLRADSPTLPENQGPGTAGQAPLKSTDSIEIEAR